MTALAGKRALVTGASSGIGAATARALAAAGAHVLATGRNADALAPLAADGIEIMTGDLVDPAFPPALVERMGVCDILVANAGRLKHAPFLESKLEDWRAVFELNVLATLHLIQCAAIPMAARGSGHIVLISSRVARRVGPNSMVYAASKHAIAAVAQGLRMELGPRGLRVTEVAPGLVRTAVFREIDHPVVQAGYAAMAFPYLEPEDIAEAILGAVLSRPGVSPDLIELRPVGQPA
jgi:NADP-dependent 3-hydroxy acid dehydrogenase YdfG